MSFASQYKMLQHVIECKRADIRDLEVKIHHINRQLPDLEELAASMSEKICPECQGYGNIRVFIDQDETKLHNCRSCGGTGLKL